MHDMKLLVDMLLRSSAREATGYLTTRTTQILLISQYRTCTTYGIQKAIRTSAAALPRPTQSKSLLANVKNPSQRGNQAISALIQCIDTVHQVDQDKVKGVYHINAVDEETQFEIVCSVERISEQYLLPVLEQMLAAFPFKIINFHSDNGSEYINKPVLELLNKLLIDFTKSRSRHSNDNALAESKNASIVRKAFGYQYISKKWANKINVFNINFLNPYINFTALVSFLK